LEKPFRETSCSDIKAKSFSGNASDELMDLMKLLP
jgi:hypothetical protein